MIRPPETPVAECVALFREGHVSACLHHAWRLPAPDLSDVFASLTPSERVQFATLLPPRLAARGLNALPVEAHPHELLAALPVTIAADIVRTLNDDDAANLLSAFPTNTREGILTVVEKRQAIDNLLQYGERTAGRMMTTAVITVTASDSIYLAIESVRRQAVDLPHVEDLYVIDVGRHLVGILSFRSLVMARAESLVREVMEPVVERVVPTDSRESVTRRLQRYHLSSLPVIDEAGRLLGRVTSDDVSDVAAAEATDNFLRFGGVAPDVELGARWPAAVRSRLPTLYSNLLTAFLAAALVHAVTGGSGRLIPLLIWMPIVAGMGGNAGIQSLAITLHRLSQGRLPWNRRRVVLAKEVVVGMVNGAVIGAIVGGVAMLLGETWRAGLVITLAMVVHLPLSGGLAAIFPMIVQRARLDPGIASAPAVTSFLDVLGLAILLGLGAIIL